MFGWVFCNTRTEWNLGNKNADPAWTLAVDKARDGGAEEDAPSLVVTLLGTVPRG